MPIQFVNIEVIAPGIAVILEANVEFNHERNQTLIVKLEAMRPVLLLNCKQADITDFCIVLDRADPISEDDLSILQTEFSSCVLHEHKTQLWTNSVEPYYMIRYQYILSSTADIAKFKNILKII